MLKAGVRIMYVREKIFNALKDKLENGASIPEEEVKELHAKDTPDTEMMIPVDMTAFRSTVALVHGPAWAMVRGRQMFLDNPDKEKNCHRPQKMTALEWKQVLGWYPEDETPEPPPGGWHSDPAWSQSGSAAIGTWASSIIDDQNGKPDINGPAQLLAGKVWVSRRGQTEFQWIVFDLQLDRSVSHVRVSNRFLITGTQWKTNPQSMQLQSGESLNGPWTTRSTFLGCKGSGWTVSRLREPFAARWWRLLMLYNFGDENYVCLTNFGLGFEMPDAMAEHKATAEAERQLVAPALGERSRSRSR